MYKVSSKFRQSVKRRNGIDVGAGGQLGPFRAGSSKLRSKPVSKQVLRSLQKLTKQYQALNMQKSPSQRSLRKKELTLQKIKSLNELLPK